MSEVNMHGGETFPTNNTEANSATESENPWQKMAEEAPPFNSGETQSTDIPEVVDKKAELDDYYTVGGVEQKNIDKINISTEQGKYEWLDGLLANGVAYNEARVDDFLIEHGISPDIDSEDLSEEIDVLSGRDGSEYGELVRTQERLKRQSKILKNLDIDGDGGILGALTRRMEYHNVVINNPKASEQAREMASENYDATAQLYTLLSSEVNRRSSNNETQEAEQRVGAINVVDVIDQMDMERDAFEKNLEAVKKERQRRIDWEKSHYGYVEGEGRAPMSVLAAEEDINRLRSKIIQKEKDTDLLYKLYKENGKNQSLSSSEAQNIIARMTQERDAKMALIDEKLGKVEKKSEEWKKLKQERAEIYRTIPDDAVERIMELFSQDKQN